MRATLTSEFRLVDGLRTHTRRSADPTAPGTPPVVLVHGLAVSHRYLTPLAETLGTSHPVYVPDLPGFGLSARPGHSYDLRQHVAHLLAWLDAYRMPPVCLVGHSFGAEVAAALAVARPGAVRALVLAGPTSDPTARSRRGLVGRWLVAGGQPAGGALAGTDPGPRRPRRAPLAGGGHRRALSTQRGGGGSGQDHRAHPRAGRGT
ncbi:alpha/beta fold hydrolase [Micromonospora wenchangensis]